MATEEQNDYKSNLTDFIDDATYGRFDKRKCALSLERYLGEDRLADIQEKARQKSIEAIKEKRPGLGLKDMALLNASFLDRAQYEPGMCRGSNQANVGYRSWTKAGSFVRTPQELGVPRYEGDPKEAAEIVKHAAINFGACRVGITGLDKRHIYQYSCEGKEIVFEPVEEPYETKEKRVIPEKCKYTVVMLLQMSREDFSLVPLHVGSHVPILTYMRIDLLTAAVADFIRGLGYTALPSANDTACNVPFALEAGLGELGRTDRLINPDFGSLIRICKVFTDLPMELDGWKNSGIARFCRDCRRCAEACPVKALNTERDPSFEVKGPWANAGHKAWFGDSVRCWTYARSVDSVCGICLNVCPWNKPKGLLHTLIKAIIKKTSLFNKFFVTADKFFGYGKQGDPEKWWKLKLPTYGIDTRR
jgi:epoxyqueuosine reductase